MSSHIFRSEDLLSADEVEVRTLYRQLLDAWNKRSASAMAILFAEDGELVGFDGSQLSERLLEIASTLQQIFS